MRKLDAYLPLCDKAAASLHSLARNRALVNGRTRTVDGLRSRCSRRRVGDMERPEIAEGPPTHRRIAKTDNRKRPSPLMAKWHLAAGGRFTGPGSGCDHSEL